MGCGIPDLALHDSLSLPWGWAPDPSIRQQWAQEDELRAGTRDLGRE